MAAQVLLFVLLSGHFPFSILPVEQSDMDRIIESSVGRGAKASSETPRLLPEIVELEVVRG